MAEVNLLDKACYWVPTDLRSNDLALDTPLREDIALDPYDVLLVAGERVTAGRYRRVDAPDGNVLELKTGDRLPASWDGHIATYARVPEWQRSLPR